MFLLLNTLGSVGVGNETMLALLTDVISRAGGTVSNVTLDGLDDLLAFSVNDFESVSTLSTDVVFLASNTVVDLANRGSLNTLVVLEVEVFLAGGADVVHHTFGTVLDFAGNRLGNTGSFFDQESFGTGGTDVVLISTFNTVHDITFGNDSFNTGDSVIKRLEARGALLTDGVLRAEVAVLDVTD